MKNILLFFSNFIKKHCNESRCIDCIFCKPYDNKFEGKRFDCQLREYPYNWKLDK